MVVCIFRTLGWDASTWGDHTEVTQTYWNDLTGRQQDAAGLLGYSEDTWNEYAEEAYEEDGDEEEGEEEEEEVRAVRVEPLPRLLYLLMALIATTVICVT